MAPFLQYNPAFDLDEGDMDTFRGTSFHRVDVSAQLGNTVDDYAHSDSQWIDNRSYIDEDEESSASEQVSHSAKF